MIHPFFFFNDTATTDIYTLSLHDALPISGFRYDGKIGRLLGEPTATRVFHETMQVAPVGDGTAWVVDRVHHRIVQLHVRDRKSTRLNSSHANISYAVFCLKKKKRPSICIP